jgi:hypothetical protein
MGALTDLWKSERGLLTALILIAAGILAGLAVLTADQWMDFTKFIFVTYVSGKTVTGTVQILRGSAVQPSPEARQATPAEVAALDKRIAEDNKPAEVKP